MKVRIKTWEQLKNEAPLYEVNRGNHIVTIGGVLFRTEMEAMLPEDRIITLVDGAFWPYTVDGLGVKYWHITPSMIEEVYND